jgi:hypothetical protein
MNDANARGQASGGYRRMIMGMVRRGLLWATAMIALLLGSWASPARADPIGGTHKEVFPVTCAGETFLVVGGVGAPAQVVDGQEVLIPASFIQESSWIDPETGELVTQIDIFSVGQGNRTGQQNDQITCTYSATFQDPEVGPVMVNGTVLGFFAPSG